MDENAFIGITNYKWITSGMVVLLMVLAHSFVKLQMVSKWQIIIYRGLGEMFESSSSVYKTGTRRCLSQSESESKSSSSCGDVLM